jgi:hypothetical protein
MVLGKSPKKELKKLMITSNLGANLIDRNKVDIMDQIHQTRSEIMKRIEELDDISAGRNDNVTTMLGAGNDLLRELKANSLHLKM